MRALVPTQLRVPPFYRMFQREYIVDSYQVDLTHASVYSGCHIRTVSNFHHGSIQEGDQTMTILNAGLVIMRDHTGAAGVVANVQQAETRGVPRVWSTVGGAFPDPVTSFAAAAATTERIGLGTSVVPAYPIHPIVLATQALAVEGLAPGRIRLGIGTSHRPIIEDRFGIPMHRPLAFLREYLLVLRGLLHDGGSDFSGDFFNVNIALPGGVTPPQTPVPISALRKNAFELAGELADGAITWVTPVHYIVNTGIPALERGAAKAGRAQRPPVIAHIPVAVSTDRAAARQAFRAQFPTYSKLPFYAAMFSDAGFPVTAAGEMTDELVDELAVSGSVEEIHQRLASLHDLGIDELLISPVPVHDAAAELDQLSAILANRIP